MKQFLVIPMMIVGIVCFFSPGSYAGNTTNSSSTGNATAVVLCRSEDPIEIEHSHVAINTDTCECESYDANSGIDCEAGADNNSCAECLASLQRGGLSIVGANGYYDDSTSAEGMHYLLTGNGGPFVTRFGCFCD